MGRQVARRAPRRFWTAADLRQLRRRYPHEPTADIAAALGRSVTAVYNQARKEGLAKTAAYLASPAACRLRRGDQIGRAFQFRKGHVPANKGLRRPGYAPGRMRETQFKKGTLNGHAAQHYQPVGSTRLVDGYVYRKVSAVPRVPWTVNWKLEHHLVWTAARGPIPRGHNVTFVNGNRQDTRLENLALVHRRDHMARNTIHRYPEPVKGSIRALSALRRAIRRRTRGQEESDR